MCFFGKQPDIPFILCKPSCFLSALVSWWFNKNQNHQDTRAQSWHKKKRTQQIRFSFLVFRRLIGLG